MNYYKKKKNKEKSIALERIKELFKQADLIKNQKLADRYVELARKLSSKTKTKIPSSLKRRFCKNCKSHLRYGTTLRVRLNNGKKTYSCLKCNKVVRVPYKAN